MDLIQRVSLAPMKGVENGFLIATIFILAGCGGPKPPVDRQPIVFPPPHPATSKVTVDPLLDLAAVGDAASQYKLGMRLDEQKSYNEAAKWYRLAAEQGHREAQFNFSCMLVEGIGVEADALEAAKWCRKAAEQGLTEAQFNLGKFYEEGRGVTQFNSEAAKWYRLAADQGYAPAQFRMGDFLLRGKGIGKNEKEAVRFLTPAAQQGHVDAQYFLGFMMARGQGTGKNLVRAYVWLNLASAKRHTGAQKEKVRLAKEMLTADVAKAQRLSFLFEAEAMVLPVAKSAPISEPEN